METETMAIDNELVCVMASLGYHDDHDYFQGEDCLPSLKDLIKFLRHEDDSCNIRRQMGESQLLQKDLLPLFIYHGDDKELIDIVIRLLVNLTSPTDICFNKLQNEAVEAQGKTKNTNTYQAKYLQVINYLQAYKDAFTNEKAMAAVAAQLGRILQMEWEDRGDDEFMLFERLLLLLRNILHVPASPDDEKRTDDDASLHDQILWNMHVNGIDDLLIFICSSPEESRWSMHAIEIVSLMLREQNPEKLAHTSNERSDIEKNEDARALLLAKENEEISKKNSSKNFTSSRHSRFGGSFWVKNMQGVGKKNTLVHHKHISDPKDISFDHKKYRARRSARQQEAQEDIIERTSSHSIRLLLKEFSIKFLEDCYNPLMRLVKDNIVSKRSQENDETYYLWALRFFMAFNRIYSFKVEYVSETLNMNAFYYILKQINHYYDNVSMHKRGGWEPWQRRLHFGIQGYKELLTYIASMDASKDETLKDASSMMKNNVFYHEEYRGIFLVLIRHYDSHKQTKKYLADLVDTFHIFMKMLEKFCGDKGPMLVKTKKKKAKKRQKRPTTQQQAAPQLSAEQLEEIWEDDVAPSLSSILQGNEDLPENNESPFDPTSDVPDEEQRTISMIKIQDYLRQGKNGEAVGAIRASRECWPDETLFGTTGISPEDEFTVIRNLLFQELERPAFVENNEVEEEEFNEEEEEEEERMETVEREFNIKSFIASLVSPQILIPYNYLLKSFKTNTPFTNHAIIKMMHRVSVDLKFPEMLFQLSLFLTFYEILDVECTRFKEMAKFAKYITNKFIESAKERPTIFVEALFWKGTGDCYRINEREDIHEKAKHREKWTFEEEEELKSLYDQYKESDDVVGDILKSIGDQDRTRRQISNKLVRLRVVDSAKDLPKPKKPKASDWTEEQTDELHRLYEEFKDAEEPIANILTGLTSGKSKNIVIKQLIDTGKISDRSEVAKKKQKKERKNKRKNQDFKDQLDEMLPTDTDSEKDEEEEESDDFEKFLESQRNGSEVGGDGSDPGNSDNDISIDQDDGDDLPPNASLTQMIQSLKQSGFSSQLVWLETRLSREMEGRLEDNGEWFATPLLTMTDNDEKAMRNKLFRKVLRKIGLQPPEDCTVAPWWTIPSDLSPDRLKKLVTDLQESGRPSNVTNERDTDASDENTLTGDKSQQANKKPTKKRRAIVMNDSDSDSEVEALVIANTADVESSNGNIRRAEVNSDSENEDAEGGREKYSEENGTTKEEGGNNQQQEKKLKTSKFGNSFLDSDDDEGNSDEESENLNDGESSKTEMKVSSKYSSENKISNEPVEKAKGTKRRSALFDSDSDDETLGSMKMKGKRSRLHLNDEDDEEKENKTRTNPISMEVEDSINQHVTSSKLRLDDEETEPLHDQSALNFSLRLSDDEEEEEESVER